MSWKPDGYTSASPYLIVRDAEATLRFLERAFQATRLRIHARDGGAGIKHAEARLDDTVIMLGEMPETVAAHVHVYFADADAALSKAVEAGGHIIQEMSRSGDGDYRGGIADPNGIVWWISTQED